MSRQTKPTTHLQQQQRTSEIQMVGQTFSGPLPPPEALARYNEVLEGSAERILAMAESQNHHRQTLESDVVNSNISAQRLGVILGFIVAMTAILGGIYLAATGKPVIGLSSIISALAALVGTFIYGKRKQAKDLDNKKS